MLTNVRRLLDSYLNDKQRVMKGAIILITRIWRDGGDEMEVFIGRQPIFNLHEQVVAYELLYRSKT